jgi:hypothetical protein
MEGMSISPLNSPTMDNPVASPATATPNGITVATTARKVTKSTTSAASMPIISAGPSERSFSTVGSSPPNSTCTPACSAGVGGVEQLLQRGAAELGGRAVELHGRERGRAVG